MKKYLLIVLLVGVCFGQTEKIITRWEDGTPKKINYYDGKGFDEVLVGVKTYYSNGDLRSKTRYNDNVRNGEYLFYLEGNKLLIRGDYINGKPTDESWIVYKPHEIKSNHGNYIFSKKFEKNDPQFSRASYYYVKLEFHDNGEPSKYGGEILLKKPSNDEREYENIGLHYDWYESGMLKKITEYGVTEITAHTIPDQKYFKTISYYETGEKEIEMLMSYDFNHTQLDQFYKNGNKQLSFIRKGSETVYRLEYDINGNLMTN